MTKRPVELSQRRVFVLHLGTVVDQRRGVLEGRIEHVSSGRVLRFRRSDELLAFLAEAHDARPRPTAITPARRTSRRPNRIEEVR